MRVISGSAKGTKLVAPNHLYTRPTTDRIKETVFNLLGINGCMDKHILDLYSGSGALGIEALSRGASSCVFIEKDARACQCIRDNLKKTRLEDRGILYKGEVMSILPRIRQMQKMDIIFMDPPYHLGEEKQVLAKIKSENMLAVDGIIVLEASKDNVFPFFDTLGYEVLKEKKYGITKHLFLKIKEGI